MNRDETFARAALAAQRSRDRHVLNLGPVTARPQAEQARSRADRTDTTGHVAGPDPTAHPSGPATTPKAAA